MLHAFFRYSASLPERLLRSAAAAVGGGSKLLTDAIVPRSLRKTTFYQVTLGNTQRFLIHGLGQVAAKDGPLPDDLMARKIAGNMIDAAALFAFHVSPLWFFTLVADGAAGSRAFLERIVTELRADGVLPPDAAVRTAEDLLEALGRAARSSALPIDEPPLTKEDFAKLREELGRNYGDLLKRSAGAVPSPESIWAALEEFRRAEKVPLLTAFGAMTLAGARAAGRAGGALFQERVLNSYAESLADVRREGFARFLARESRPYLDAASGAFDPKRPMWTDRLLRRFFP